VACSPPADMGKIRIPRRRMDSMVEIIDQGRSSVVSTLSLPHPPSMPICHATLSLKPDKRWCSPFPPLLSLQAKNSNSTQSLISPHQIAVTLCKISDLYQLSLDPNQHPVGSQMFVDWISRSLPQLTEQIPILPFFSGPPAPLSLLHTI
jgi:hypothetical protein